MNEKIIKFDFESHAIQFEESGWFNATIAAKHFNKRPIDWLRLPETEKYTNALCRKYKVRKSHFVKTKRGGDIRTRGTWLHPKLAVAFARWLDDDFAVWCDELIDKLIHGHIQTNEDWKRVRHEASSSFKVMNTMLNISRFEKGKDTCSYHYMNESKMVNWALSGKFAGLNRESLSFAELDTLAKLEARNTLLIAKGMSYHDRKPGLLRFAMQLREQQRSLIAA